MVNEAALNPLVSLERLRRSSIKNKPRFTRYIFDWLIALAPLDQSYYAAPINHYFSLGLLNTIICTTTLFGLLIVTKSTLMINKSSGLRIVIGWLPI